MPDLCDALASNTTLYKLNLDYNDITDAGAELLHKMFDTNQTLTHLSLKDNENISAAWLQRIEECLERNREVCAGDPCPTSSLASTAFFLSWNAFS